METTKAMGQVGKKKISSGMRPTGKLHLGHLSVLENWAALQEEYQCFYFIADWHALTTAFDDTSGIVNNAREMTMDWLAAGLDPNKCSIFRQSSVKEHAELHLLLSMIIPNSWLERVPTYKDQVQQFKDQGKDITTYGFLGYPVLMSSDILIYRADAVPVGEDQLPHLELTRELARRFNHLYNTDIMIEPQALLAKVKLLPGIDNRKMSKSYNNSISISASMEEVKEKVSQMVTDPARIRKDDPGHPEVCTVYTYHTFYNQDEKEEIACNCRGGKIGCVACKKRLAEKMDRFIAPIREKRLELENNPAFVDDVLHEGTKKARIEVCKTMEMVREAMHI